MPWWALTSMVTVLAGPLTLLALKWSKRDAARRDEQYQELAQAYTRLREETRERELSGEQPSGEREQPPAPRLTRPGDDGQGPPRVP